jgi:glycosyltransferase involved in cell wall biosynthesis
MEYPFMRIPDEVTSVSETLAALYEQRYGRFVQYIPNGVEDQVIQEQSALDEVMQKYGLDPGYIMFAAGRIIPSKGAHTLLEALQGVDFPDLRVLIVGDLDQMPEYREQLRKLADERVTFLPFIAERRDVLALVQASRFFVFPSTIEAMSMMLLQVSSLGVPIVYSDIPENLSVLGSLGTVFQAGDSEDLRAKLKFAWANPEEIERLADQARQHVQQAFNWDLISARYASLYKAL